MAFCPNCGAQVEDGKPFCDKCGAPIQGAQNQAPVYAAPVNPIDHTAEFDPEDISKNKVYAMACYLLSALGIIIALLAAKDSPYAAFHARQALKLNIVTLLVTIVGSIIPIIGWIFLGIMILVLTIIEIIGFFDVCGGKAKDAAIIRSLKFLN